MQVSRREFLEAAGIAAAAPGLGLPVLGSAPAVRQGLIPADKGIGTETLAALRRRGTRRVYRGEARAALGMPCGGIAAGQLYVLGDGTLGGWHVDGRRTFSGYGAENYRPFRPQRELAQGLLLRVTDSSGRMSRAVLADAERGGSYDAIEFIGEYPVAEVHYRSARNNSVPPVEVVLRAYSPFVPLDARASAMPCTVLRLALRNRSGAPVTGALRGWLENGVERPEPGRPAAARRNRVVREPGVTSVFMDAFAEEPPEGSLRPDRVLADFEGGSYGGWTVEGEAFGTAPARGTQVNQNPVSGFDGTGLVNSYAGSDAPTGRLTSPPFVIDRRYMTFLIGGGAHAGRTCMNLLVGGAVLRSVTGRNDERLEPAAWDLGDLAGREARLEIVDAASGGWGHVNLDQIVLVDRLPPELRPARPDSPTNGSMALSFLGEAAAVPDGDPQGETLARHEGDPTAAVAGGGAGAPVGVIEAPFSLPAGGSAELVFAVSWWFPNLHTGNGVMYSNWFADALDVARHAAAEDRELLEQTELFRRTYYEETTLPWWLALRLMMPVANLATGTAQWWRNGRFWAWEGVGCCHGTCAHVWNYAQAEARLFPELARSVRLMQDLGTAFEESTGRVAFRGDVRGGFDYAADAQAGTVLKFYREHLQSADDSFLRAAWPRVRLAMEFMISKDAAHSAQGRPDGVVVGSQHNTFDIDFVGANTFVGSLYLAALLAAAAMADRVGDAPAAARYREIFGRGRAWAEANLFNGEYFVQRLSPEDSRSDQYGEGCLTDQLFGQTWARLLDLPGVFDDRLVVSALRSVYRYNWAPAVGPYNEKFPPERFFARGGEGGLLVCTWPRGGRPDQPLRYRDEVWTGCEYQAASGMIWEGLVDEALVILDALDRRYDGTEHNPWNEVECGDHYARALASWGAYLALCGFVYDGPAGLIGMAPRLSPEDFAAFFSAAQGWGRITQRRAGRVQHNGVEVRWGRLRVAAFAAELPPVAAGAARCDALAAGEAIGAQVQPDGGRWRAILDRPATLEAGQRLDLRFSW
jgi:uncharacterized protein (DUF608 family)